ncbi:hypothetical protein FOA52_002373 [Chlamydomonas sp. UWO 241]|nr:hypothetical protein FOA52_002373 [Chlamydomonas sp. UWO 241]
MGGTTFIAGTVLLFFPNMDTLSALLYTIGSVGFALVDLQELCTFTQGHPLPLRVNIACSLVGSLLYIVGSVGFFPKLGLPAVGIWGFILGSAAIGCSQLWKTHRIGRGGGDGGEVPGCFRVGNLVSETGAFTAAGVELSAGIGAWCFFVGTSLYQLGPLEGPASVLATVLWIWVAGSLSFTAGGCFLAWRHFVMGIV